MTQPEWCMWCEVERPCLCDDLLEDSCDCFEEPARERVREPKQDEWWGMGN